MFLVDPEHRQEEVEKLQHCLGITNVTLFPRVTGAVHVTGGSVTATATSQPLNNPLISHGQASSKDIYWEAFELSRGLHTLVIIDAGCRLRRDAVVVRCSVLAVVLERSRKT